MKKQESDFSNSNNGRWGSNALQILRDIISSL